MAFVNQTALVFQGAASFRSRVLLAFLSQRPIIIHNIRTDASTAIGLAEHEILFLKILSQISDGTIVEIDESGANFKLVPGIILGGQHTFDCGTSKPIGYFLEMILPLALFGKKPTSFTITGITQGNPEGSSVDSIKMVNFGILRAWGFKHSDFDIKVLKRGFFPQGGGKIIFMTPLISSFEIFEPREFKDPGLIKKVRGIATCAKVSPTIATRIIDSCKLTLSKLLPDALIYSDTRSGAEAGDSPGYSLILVGESSTGSLVRAEGTGKPGEIPEDFTNRVTLDFLARCAVEGWGDVSSQWFILLLAALSSEDVSSVLLAPLSKFTTEFLQELYAFFGIKFRLKENASTGTVLATCTGLGFRNIAFKSA